MYLLLFSASVAVAIITAVMRLDKLVLESSDTGENSAAKPEM
jgi:hypothetical protein